MTDDWIREPGKRDRAARLARGAGILSNAGEHGITPDELARQLGVSRRTAYRDLAAIDGEMGIGVWNNAGRWGADPDALLPEFRFSLHEAMAVLVSARLLVRHADQYDPDLGAAFEKLAGALPPVLAEHVARTISVMAERPTDPALTQLVQDLTKAWSGRRIVEFTYDISTYDPSRGTRRARVRPYLIEPSLRTHALYLIGYDEARTDIRTFKIARIRDLSVTPETFEAPVGEPIEERLAVAWDIIADRPPVDVVLRFEKEVAGRVAETRWHPSQVVETAADGSIVWRARVSGSVEIRLWILEWGADVEVLEPAELRADVAATLARAAARYAGS